MTVKEINERIDKLEWEIFMEEMKDRGYDVAKVHKLNLEIASLNAMLNEREGE